MRQGKSGNNGIKGQPFCSSSVFSTISDLSCLNGLLSLTLFLQSGSHFKSGTYLMFLLTCKIINNGDLRVWQADIKEKVRVGGKGSEGVVHNRKVTDV